MYFSCRRISQTSHLFLFHTQFAEVRLSGVEQQIRIRSKLEAGAWRAQMIHENESVRKTT